MFSKLLALAMVLSVSAVQAQYLGFQYRDGFCQNEEGVKGYNPNYWGECGKLTGGNYEDQVSSADSVSGADFSKSNLSRANFHAVAMTKTNFEMAKMEGAILAEGSLDRAILTNADLKGATLYWASMDKTIIYGADLRGADLRGAVLDLALINEKTNFEGAIFNRDTWLPFGKREALKRGMKFIPSER